MRQRCAVAPDIERATSFYRALLARVCLPAITSNAAVQFWPATNLKPIVMTSMAGGDSIFFTIFISHCPTLKWPLSGHGRWRSN